jgi:hypothetical protein
VAAVILAAGRVFSAPLQAEWGVWRSVDSGDSWQRMSLDLGVSPVEEVEFSVAISPLGEALLVALMPTDFEPPSRLFRSWDNGETWGPAADPSEGQAIGTMYLGRNAPPIDGFDPEALYLPPPPTGPFNENAYLTGATYSFHDAPCTPLQPPGGGGGPEE